MSKCFDVPSEEIPDDVAIGGLQQWDSLGHLSLMLELESQFNIPLSRKNFEACSSINGIVNCLESAGIKHLD